MYDIIKVHSSKIVYDIWKILAKQYDPRENFNWSEVDEIGKAFKAEAKKFILEQFEIDLNDGWTSCYSNIHKGILNFRKIGGPYDRRSYSGHLYRHSGMETDSDCGNCNGGRCESCVEIWYSENGIKQPDPKVAVITI